MAARRTFAVGKDVRIDLLADGGAGSTSGRTADERAEDGTGYRAERSSDHAEGRAGFSTAERGGGATSGTSRSADGSAGLAGGVARNDELRTAAGTGKRMGHISAS